MQGKGWTDAGDIKVDDYIATREGDAWVNEVDRITNSTQVYNFAVDQDATYFAGPGELWVHNACKTATPAEIRNALGDREKDYYLAEYDDGIRIVRRHASPDTPKLGHRIGDDGKVEIFEITDNIDFAARPISTQKFSVNDVRDKALDMYEKHRKKYNTMIEAANANGELKRVAMYQRDRIRQSERIGEAVAHRHFKNLGYEEVDLPNSSMGNGKQGTFDMVYRDKDGNLVVVEAKGGNSQLGSRQLKYAKDDAGNSINGRAQQGTKEYMDDIIANYRAKLGKDHPFVEELIEARKDGEIKYVSVRQPLNKDGSLKNDYIVNEFKL